MNNEANKEQIRHVFNEVWGKSRRLWPVGLLVSLFSLSVVVVFALAPSFTSTPVTTAVSGELYSYDVDAVGPPPPTYTLAVTSPTGMVIDLNSGLINWTAGVPGDYPVSVTAQNSDGTNTQNFVISVGTRPQITSTPITEAAAGQTYTYDVDATGIPTPTYTLNTGPAGMTISETTGIITWLPAAVGNFNVSVSAVNVHGSDTQNFSINVGAAPHISSSPVTDGVVGQVYTYDVDAIGVPSPTYTLSLTSPAGMTINQLSGLISWTPTDAQVGVNRVSVQAVNQYGSDPQDFEVTVPSTAVCLYDPVSYWPLDDTTNDVSLDMIWSNNGACSGATCPGVAAALSGSALDFDGLDDGLDVATPTRLDWNNGDSFSIQTWVNTSQTCAGDDNKVIAGTFSGSDGAWWLGCGSTANEAVFYLQGAGSPPPGYSLKGTQAINDGQWHQITAVRDGPSMETRLYVDGVLETAAVVIYNSSFANNSALHIGYYGTVHTRDYYFDGLIDELIIYNRALSSTEIWQHYLNTQNGVAYCAATAVTPNIFSTPALEAPGGGQYTYQAQATGIPAPAFALGGTPPSGMQIDATTGLLTWTVDENLAGTPVEVRVQASNSGGTNEQVFQVDVLRTYYLFLPLINN